MRQDVVLLDIDSQTHTLESRKREGAVVGYNRKKPGKPCLQWNVGFVRGEAISQRLMPVPTHGSSSLKWIVSSVAQKLSAPPSILRLDGGYLSKDTLSYVTDKGYFLCMSARYDWIVAQGVEVDETQWQRCDATTRLYELGQSRVISTWPGRLRTVLVEKEQDPFPLSKSQKKILRYGIIERLPFELKPAELYQFYHGRQTIENFFKESTGPFNAGKLPSQKFRGNEAYLHLVTIAENCVWVNRMVDTFYASRSIAKSIGYGLDVTIQAERKVIVSVYHHPDYYILLRIAVSCSKKNLPARLEKLFYGNH